MLTNTSEQLSGVMTRKVSTSDTPNPEVNQPNKRKRKRDWISQKAAALPNCLSLLMEPARLNRLLVPRHLQEAIMLCIRRLRELANHTSMEQPLHIPAELDAPTLAKTTACSFCPTSSASLIDCRSMSVSKSCQ